MNYTDTKEEKKIFHSGACFTCSWWTKHKIWSRSGWTSYNVLDSLILLWVFLQLMVKQSTEKKKRKVTVILINRGKGSLTRSQGLFLISLVLVCSSRLILTLTNTDSLMFNICFVKEVHWLLLYNVSAYLKTVFVETIPMCLHDTV